MPVILSYEENLFFKKTLLRNKQYSNKSWIIVMVKWFCSSALCYNNFVSKDGNGRPLKYYRLPREENLQPQYRKIFRTDGMNWNKGHTCPAYWSHGERKSINDTLIPADQLQKIPEKFETTNNILEIHHKNYIYDTKIPT